MKLAKSLLARNESEVVQNVYWPIILNDLLYTGRVSQNLLPKKLADALKVNTGINPDTSSGKRSMAPPSLP